MDLYKQEPAVAASFRGPSSYTLFLFSPPKEMTSQLIRKRALVTFIVSVALMAVAFFVFQIVLGEHSPSFSKYKSLILILSIGFPLVLLPASIFRLAFGVSESNKIVIKFLRGLTGLIIFCITYVPGIAILGNLLE